MKEVNPVDLSNSIKKRYLKYLLSINVIENQELRALLLDELSDYEYFKGPFIECPPNYAFSTTLRDLTDSKQSPNLHKKFLKFSSSAINLDMPLYKHQVDSLKNIQEGKSIVIATGTGSGKTECFLYPIFDDIFKNPSEGVRAVIIYPMNALANDQLERMRNILKGIDEITFGRYTGETPQSLEELKKQARQEPEGILPNERFYREDIQKNPPNILLTNFAMLEYLMLRPIDNPIFSHKSVKYLVLDETHLYRGAQAIDISMLLRRFKSNQSKNMQFVFTSATISQKEEAVRRFASKLCGEEHKDIKIIFGEEQYTEESENNLVDEVPVFEKNSFESWCNAIDDCESLYAHLTASGFESAKRIEKSTSAKMLYDLLRNNHYIHRIKKEGKSFKTADSMAEKIFGSDDEENIKKIMWFLLMGGNAKSNIGEKPLLSTKFHYFLRGVNGIYACVNPDCTGKRGNSSKSDWKALFLKETKKCPFCAALVVPVSTCVFCGLPVIKVYEDNGFWHVLPQWEHSSRCHILALPFLPEYIEKEEQEFPQKTICLKCGKVYKNKDDQCCEKPALKEFYKINFKDDKEDLKKCPRCQKQTRSFDSVFREFRTGNDAPTTVIAENILRQLPQADVQKPAGGRSLIAFSDSRQGAAFFASSLDRTTNYVAFIKPLTEAVKNATEKNNGEPVMLQKAAEEYVKLVSEESYISIRKREEQAENDIEYFEVIKPGSLTQNQKNKFIKEEIEIELLNQACSPFYQKNTLSSLGFLNFSVEFTEAEKIKLQQGLPELFSDEINGFSIMQVLLRMMLIRKAVDLPYHVKPKFIDPFSNQTVYFHRTESCNAFNKYVYRWNPFSGGKLAMSRSIILQTFKKAFPNREEKYFEGILHRAWDILTECAVLKTRGNGYYQINHERIVVENYMYKYICSNCGILISHDVNMHCPIPSCMGKKRELDEEEKKWLFQNHNYERMLQPSFPVKVEEHTAQISNNQGMKYQEAFRSHDINVLSSSTTFELGIDIGHLKSVFLRNIPPSKSSYLQRTGRAGRRADGASFVITFAINSPHDAYYFQNVEKFLEKPVTIPSINLENMEIIQRHVNSFLLSSFLLDFTPGIKNYEMTVNWFLAGETVLTEFMGWMLNNKERLLKEIQAFLPKESPLITDEPISYSMRSMENISDQVKNDVEDYDQKILQTEDKRIRKLKDIYLSGSLIDFLSLKGWLPSYAFPQDVVELRIMDPNYQDQFRLHRDREFGIAEYAPGMEIIAGKKQFVSRGVLFEKQTPEIEDYSYCSHCKEVYLKQKQEVCKICKKPMRTYGSYVIPKGFTTSISEKACEPDLFRMKPPQNTEVFLFKGADESEFKQHPRMENIFFAGEKNGWLFRANRGFDYKGFNICEKCGSQKIGKAGKGEKKTHKTSWGTNCNGVFRNIHLAHLLKTHIFQIRFIGNNEAYFWYSLAEALSNGISEVLDIEKRDIGSTFRRKGVHENSGEIIIYDRVPGGSGFLMQIPDSLENILKSTYDRILNCSCDINSSCMCCLRSYNNQFIWDLLKRAPLIEWFETLPDASKI